MNVAKDDDIKDLECRSQRAESNRSEDHALCRTSSELQAFQTEFNFSNLTLVLYWIIAFLTA